MAHETATLFFAMLTVLLASLILAIVALGVAGRTQRGLLGSIRPLAIEGAALVAVTCTAGSLYLSEVAGFVPCRLCWVQRGFMYPAAVLLVAAAITGRQRLAIAAGALALIGLPVSLFHRLEQATGEIGGVCDVANPCSGKWVEHFGFVTIPTMAAVGFAGILTLIALSRSTP